MSPWRITAFALVLAWGAAPGLADETPLEAIYGDQLERLRAEAADQVQLQAYDLLDELVFGWIEAPPFGSDTSVVLADVTVPVGFGSGLQALLENHLTGLLLKNAKSRVVLTYCPGCSSVVVHSGAKGTIVARGVDLPGALESAGLSTGSKHALFLDFEMEGSSLVLRARITVLRPELPIVWARTVSTSTSSPALLRSGDPLKSAEAARREYLDVLEGGFGSLRFPFRFGIRNYAQADGAVVVSTPFLWLQGGVEAGLSQARAWTGSFSIGASWWPQMHTAWLAQARISRLLTGSASSLIHPDLYGFIGAAVITIHGPSALPFANPAPTIQQIVGAVAGLTPNVQETFAALQFGLEMRVRNRIGLGVFVESMPLTDASGVGSYLDLGVITLRSMGVEVSVCF